MVALSGRHEEEGFIRAGISPWAVVAPLWCGGSIQTIATVPRLYYRPVVANLGVQYRSLIMNTKTDTLACQTSTRAVRKMNLRGLIRLSLIVATALAIALFAIPSRANDLYVAQSVTGAANGSSCANADSVAWFNSSANWGSGASQIGPGTTVHLCGTISTPMTAQGSGTSGSPLTILWETNAKLSAPNWGPDPSQFNAAPAFYSSGNSYLILDGGTNGVIEGTSNGTGGATQYDNTGVDLEHGTGLTIRNLTISDMYVHTCTLPIGNCNDENGGLSGGIWVLDGCSNLNIYNNIIHDMKWGISCAADAGSFSNTNIYNNQVYHVDHGVSIEEGNSNVSFNGVYIHNNTIHDFQNWDDAGNGNHHDGLHSWSYNSGDALDNLEVYNNYFYGDVGVGFNAWLYEEGVATHAAYFNNLLVDTAGDASAGCGYICLGDSGGDAMYVFNNTIVGHDLNDNTGISSYSSGDVIENNLSETMYKFTAPNSNSPAAWDYNNYWNAGGCGWDCGTSFSGWTANGFDLHGSYANPNLTASYQPTSSSTAIIGKGVNLTSYGIAALNSDKAGVARPSSGGWTIGAYQYSGSASNPPNPPTSLTATVQ